MHPPGADTVLVRHGDINTKSNAVKGQMLGSLLENIEAILAARDVPGTVEKRWDRPIVRTDKAHVEAATAVTADAFGVVSASPAVAITPEREAIYDVLERTARAHYDGGTFAVEARRADKSRPYTSEDLAREAGDRIWQAVEDEFEPAVDLDDPDLEFGVEVRREVAYVYLESRDGPGGLPLGSQARMVALISGGIDSPVAAYEMMRRGVPIVPVYISLGQYGGVDHEARALETVGTLSRFAPTLEMTVYRVDAGDVVDELVNSMEQGRMLSLRRFFYRVGETIADIVDASGIVTGEAIGQKSSQTARNIGVTSPASRLPVHRPLLTWDKHQIVDRAREIGTFTDSTIDAGCNRVVPDQVETNAHYDRLLEAEPDDLLERAEQAARDADLIEP